MNKSDLINRLEERTGISHAEAERVVGLIGDMMKETLMRGGRIEVRGFGSFVVKTYEPYEGRNPKTGDKIYVPPKRLPFFKVGKDLKERVDKVEEE